MLHVETSSDIDQLSCLIKPVHDWHHQTFPHIFKRYSKARFREYFATCISDPNQHHLVAFDDSRAVGFTQIAIRSLAASPFRHPSRLVYVNIISVCEAYRGKGVGRLLMDNVYAFARKHKIRRVELDHWDGNREAEGFFAAQEFHPMRFYLSKDL